jgi:membrane protein YqaA with SNARE-associated domain
VVQELVQSLAHFFFSLGGFGLVLLGILDSSFLMMPLGNDLLVVALTAQHHNRVLLYAVLGAIGSTIGVALAHWVSSKTGQKALEGSRKSRQIAFVERKVKKYGGFAIGVAALAPPGFPFTPFIVVTAALQYPRTKMLIIIALCRLVRFLIEGWLAIVYGVRILEMANSPVFHRAILGLVLISVAGSAFSIWSWINSRPRGRMQAENLAS